MHRNLSKTIAAKLGFSTNVKDEVICTLSGRYELVGTNCTFTLIWDHLVFTVQQ